MEDGVMRAFVSLLAVLASASLIGASWLRASEERIKPDQLPKAASDAVKARFPGLEYTSITKETETDGRVVYDIELTQKGQKFETDVKEDGTLLEVEKEVDPKNYPKALAAAVDAKYPKAKITIVMEVNLIKEKKETPDHLEVSVETADKQEKELLFQLDGKTEFEEPAAAGSEPSDKIEISQLPKSVSDAVKKKYAQAVIKAAEKGDEDGKTVYEVSVTNGKQNLDITLDPSGKILLVEKEVPEKDLPKSVLTTAKAKNPQCTVKLCEELWKDDKLSGYEVTVETPDKKTVEIEFDAAGKEVKE
jgi:uncharacterized membrane protein YkoI